jgi:hypothetical protein
MPAKILQFISRAEQLRLRGSRNYSRYMMLTKKLIAPDSPERISWQRESAEESIRDAEWNRRHCPRPGGAVVLSILIEPLLRPLASKAARERNARDC